MAEDPRGKRRKQAKPKRNNGSHFEGSENAENHLDTKSDGTEDNRVTAGSSSAAAQPASGRDSPAGTKEPPSVEKAEAPEVAMWAAPILQDRNQMGDEQERAERASSCPGEDAVEDKESRSGARASDYATCNGTAMIYPREPKEAALDRSAGPEALDEEGKQDTPEAFATRLICPYCERGYSSWAFLSDHIKHHERERRFTCPLCGHKVQFRAQLERHLADHVAQPADGAGPEPPQPSSDQKTENRKFKCPDCSKAFKYKHHLKEHFRIHSGEKPYECPHCKKRFSHSGSYSAHLNTKKCLPPVQANGTHSGSSPASAGPGSPGDPSTPSPVRLEMNTPSERSGLGVQQELPLNYKVRNISMHCFGSTNIGTRLDFLVDAPLPAMADLPTNLNGESLSSALSVDTLLKYVNSSSGRRGPYLSTENLQSMKANGLETCHAMGHQKADQNGCPPDPSSRSREHRHSESVAGDLSPLRYPQGGFGGLQSYGRSTAEEEKVTREHPASQSQGQERGGPCDTSNLKKVCTIRTCSPSPARGHDGKDIDVARNYHGRRDSRSPTPLSDPLYETKPLHAAGPPATKEIQHAEHLLQRVTADHHRLPHHQSTYLPFHMTKPSMHSPAGSPDSSTTEGAQAEPLDLSLRRPSRELPLVPWTHGGTFPKHKGDSLGARDNFKGIKPVSGAELKPSSLYSHSLYSTLPDLLPNALNNLLQERFPILQITPNFQGVHFLPYMTYMYGGEPNYILSSRLHNKHRPLGEFFNLGDAEYPTPGEDMEEEFGPMRKRLKKTEDGLYACDLCDKTFQKSSSLLRHKYEHTGKRPHRCEICQKAFKHKHHLIEHARLHSGEKPYQCNKCGKRFSHSGSYSQHMNHRYAYCRKEEGLDLLADIPSHAAQSPDRSPSPSRNSASGLAEFEPPHPCHTYENGAASSPDYADSSGQELLQSVVP